MAVEAGKIVGAPAAPVFSSRCILSIAPSKNITRASRALIAAAHMLNASAAFAKALEATPADSDW
jgi:hypothetical protein